MKDEIKDSIKELEDLEKSEKELGDDGIDALEKALAEFADFEDLAKSCDDDEGDEDGGDDEDDDEDEGEDDRPPIKKSEDDLDLEQELIKASDAYAELEGSVDELRKSFDQKFDVVCAAIADLTTLVQAVGKGTVTLSKSLKEWGAQPGATSGAFVGTGREGGGESLTKSRSEVVSLVKSAVESGSVPAIWLTKVSVHGEACLPDHIKTAIPGL